MSKPNIQAFGGCLCTTGIALLAIRQCEDFSLFRIWTQYFRIGSNLSSHGRLCSALSLWRRAPWMVTSQYLLCPGSGVWFGFYNFDTSHSRYRRTDLWNWKKSSDMYHWASVLMSSSHKDKSSRSICRSCFGPIPWRGSRVWFSLGFSIALVIDSWSCSVYFMTCGWKINVSVDSDDSVVTVFTTFERNSEPYPGDGWSIYFVISLAFFLSVQFCLLLFLSLFCRFFVISVLACHFVCHVSNNFWYFPYFWNNCTNKWPKKDKQIHQMTRMTKSWRFCRLQKWHFSRSIVFFCHLSVIVRILSIWLKNVPK